MPLASRCPLEQRGGLHLVISARFLCDKQKKILLAFHLVWWTSNLAQFMVLADYWLLVKHFIHVKRQFQEKYGTSR